jgi:two-component system chemotaxis sensor kinase CheA
VVAVEEAKIKKINQSEVIRIRDEVIPISKMESILDSEGETKTLEDRYVVNIGLGIKRLGLIVDELLGQQEIVIKSLGEYLGDVKGIAGSTILGDGRVIMIVDVSQFIESHSHNLT